ncbi:MAG: hypothetical protein ACTHM0_03255 [Sphingomonas sp.]
MATMLAAQLLYGEQMIADFSKTPTVAAAIHPDLQPFVDGRAAR